MNKQYPLKGLTILNTRPASKGENLSVAIRKKGGQAIDLPLLKMQATKTTWLDSLPPLTQFKRAIFISSNAAQYFFDALKQSSQTWPCELYIHTIGENTATTLLELGLNVQASPEIADSEHLLALPVFQQVEKQAILIIKGEAGRPLLADNLRQRGACIHEISVYKRLHCPIDIQQLTHLWQEDNLDIILFTSLEAMQYFHEQSGHLQAWMCQKTCMVLSDRLAHAARDWGYTNIIIAAPHRILATLEQFSQGRGHDRQPQNTEH